jgi:hypothetical protein
MKRVNLLFLLFIVLVLPLTSANGLDIINQSFTVNKTIGEDITINFVITNADSFNFYNITLENAEIGNMTKIPVLTPGNSTTAAITIKTNSDFNGTLDIIGFYEAQLGSSNMTKEVEIGLTTGAMPCSFSIIKGDSVKWFNNINGKTIQIRNANTDTTMFSLEPYFNFTQQFTEPLTLNYYTYWLYGTFPTGNEAKDTCTLTVLNDVGYINNPEYDAKLNLTVEVNYIPTTLTATFITTDYNISAYGYAEGIIILNNTGNNPAKNVNIYSNWFSFYDIEGNELSNFDMNIATTKVINYRIFPNVNSTNETNKNWEQTLTISGNFENIIQKINIFIPYADLDSGNYTGELFGIELLIKQLAIYCEKVPNDPLCKTSPTVIYKDLNINENMTQEQFRAIFEYMYTVFQGMLEYITWQKEATDVMNSSITQIAIDNNITRAEVEAIKTENQGVVGTLYFVILGVCIFIIIAGGVYIIYYVMQQRKTRELRRW